MGTFTFAQERLQAEVEGNLSQSTLIPSTPPAHLIHFVNTHSSRSHSQTFLKIYYSSESLLAVEN